MPALRSALKMTVIAAVSLILVLVVVMASWCYYLGRQTYDVVAVLGQSNAEGFGTGWEPSDMVPIGGVSQFVTEGVFAGTTIPAVDRPGTPGSPVGMVGFDRVFGRDYHDATGRNALIVNAGHGTSAFTPTAGATWDPDDTSTPTNLYDDAIVSIRDAVGRNGNRLVAVLWHQGEGDVGKLDTDRYAAKLDAVVNGIRDEFGPVPFVIGSMVPEWIAEKGDGAAAIDEAHRVAAGRLADTAFAEGPTGARNEDRIHYNADGQRRLGEAYWAAYESIAA